MLKASIQTSIRAVASFASDLRGSLSFGRNGGNHRYKGVYPSYDAAVAALPPGSLRGFNHQSVAEFFVDTHFVFNPSDYAVVFWLSWILKLGQTELGQTEPGQTEPGQTEPGQTEPGQTIFDFGGGVGQCFYLYQKFICFPAGTLWRVCDLEALAQRGERLAREKNAKGIAFTTNFDDAAGAAVFLTAGTLHYVEEDLSAQLARLPRLPEHVLINRVPMYGGETYYTVQHSEHSFVPNKVMNMNAFIRGMEHLGYEKIDQWYVPRQIRIPFHRKNFVSSFSGFYFRLQDPQSLEG